MSTTTRSIKMANNNNSSCNDENKPILNKPSNPNQGGILEMGRKFGQEVRPIRRALSDINQRLAAAPTYPCVVVNKRGLSGKEATRVEKKVEDDQVQRPVTRKFSAHLSSSHQPRPEEPKKAKTTSVSDQNVFGDCIFVDAEEHHPPEEVNHPEPMSFDLLDQEELHEISLDDDHVEEVEMEDILVEEEPVIDIDGRDIKNPLAVVDYIEDIYAHYRNTENSGCVSPDYMSNQFDINEKMRAILIDWLIEVHDKFDLMPETLFLTVNLIDRFLAQQSVVRKKLQLVGLVAMLLACKYEEVSVPIVGDLILISDRAYTRNDVLQMESLMLNCLQFNMSVPTPYVFMKRFLKAAESDKKLETVAFFLMELTLVEYDMLRYPPSLLAAAAIFTAQCTLYGFRQWSKTCQWHSRYSQEQLEKCSRLIVGLHQKASTGKVTGVHRKYCSSKFGFTAKCEPAAFLLEMTSEEQNKNRSNHC